MAKEGETVIVRVERETKLRLPLLNLEGIVCVGNAISVSPYLMAACARKGVGISFMNEYGRFLARVVGPVSGNILLRKEQYRRSDDEKASAEIACSIVIGKTANAKTTLSRYLRDHDPRDSDVRTAVERLKANVAMLREKRSLDGIRGVEGESAKTYFSVFDKLIVAQKKTFFFSERSRRPPMDNVNALLSYGYTLLRHDVESALECVGLDPQAGFLHRDRPGRPSLALDIMEEFRHPFVDRMVLSLINRKEVTGKNFKQTASGAVMMDDDARKTILKNYHDRKKNEIFHEFIKEKMPIGSLFLAQAMLMARHIRGDLDAYPPLIWR